MKYKSSFSILAFQILTTIFQLAYAAFTSRLGTPLEFGYYASALATQGFLTLIFSSTFMADVIRTDITEKHSVRKIFSRSLLTGIAAFLCALGLGMVFSTISQIPLGVFLVTAAMAGLTPMQLFVWGLYSQRKQLALASSLGFIGSLTGFLFGGVCFLLAPTATSLLISPLVALIFFLTAGSLHFRDQLFPLPSLSLQHIVPSKFASRTFIYRCYWFLNSNLIRWLLIFTGAQTTLGQLNRAEVLTSVPVQQLQSSIYNPFYPKAADVARKDAGGGLFRDSFSKASASLIFLTWTSFTLLALGIGDIVLLLLGSTWIEASSAAPLLLALGAVQIPVSIFSGVVEVRDKYEKAYVADITLVIIQVAAVLAAFSQLLNLNALVLFMCIVMSIRFLWYAVILIIERVLDWRQLTYSVLVSGCTSAALFFLQTKLLEAVSASAPDFKASSLVASSLLGLVIVLVLALTSQGKKTLRSFTWLIQDN